MRDTEYAAKKRKKWQRVLRKRKPRRQGSRAVTGRKLPVQHPVPESMPRKGRKNKWLTYRFPRI